MRMLYVRLSAVAVAALLAMALAAGGAVTAQEEPEDEFTRGPGIAPDSAFYGLDIAFENARLSIATDAADRAELHLGLSEERGAEIRDVAERGKPEFVEDTQRRYSEHVNESLREADEASMDRQRLRERISNATSRHYFVLQRVREEAPEEAHQGLDRALNASLNGRERAVDAVSEDDPAAAARHRVSFADRALLRANGTADEARVREHLRIHTEEMSETEQLINRNRVRDSMHLQTHVYNRTTAHLRVMDHIRSRVPDAPTEDAMRATNRTRTRALDHVEAHDPALADRMRSRTQMPDDMPHMDGMRTPLGGR